MVPLYARAAPKKKSVACALSRTVPVVSRFTTQRRIQIRIGGMPFSLILVARIVDDGAGAGAIAA